MQTYKSDVKYYCLCVNLFKYSCTKYGTKYTILYVGYICITWTRGKSV